MYLIARHASTWHTIHIYAGHKSMKCEDTTKTTAPTPVCSLRLRLMCDRIDTIYRSVVVRLLHERARFSRFCKTLRSRLLVKRAWRRVAKRLNGGGGGSDERSLATRSQFAIDRVRLISVELVCLCVGVWSVYLFGVVEVYNCAMRLAHAECISSSKCASKFASIKRQV